MDFLLHIRNIEQNLNLANGFNIKVSLKYISEVCLMISYGFINIL